MRPCLSLAQHRACTVLTRHRPPHGQVNTPTYNRDLATATKMLVEAGASGVFNVGGVDVLGRLLLPRLHLITYGSFSL